MAFAVHYKPKKDATHIQPGIHGRFDTEEEAFEQAGVCDRWFAGRATVDVVEEWSGRPSSPKEPHEEGQKE